MKLAICSISMIVAASSAWAVPMYGPPAGASDLRIEVRNGYGPLPYGLYGSRRSHRNLSNGTGYRGRGTKSGGPAGGLPGRS